MREAEAASANQAASNEGGDNGQGGGGNDDNYNDAKDGGAGEGDEAVAALDAVVDDEDDAASSESVTGVEAKRRKSATVDFRINASRTCSSRPAPDHGTLSPKCSAGCQKFDAPPMPLENAFCIIASVIIIIICTCIHIHLYIIL
jgi:hypothetical protein